MRSSAEYLVSVSYSLGPNETVFQLVGCQAAHISWMLRQRVLKDNVQAGNT